MVENWQSTWSYCQQDYRSWPSNIKKDHQLIKIQMTQSGEKLRLRFANLYGDSPILFKKVTVRSFDNKEHQVFVNGSDEIKILPGCQLLSDVLSIPFQVGSVLEIQTYLDKEVALKSGIVTYSKLITSVENFSAGKLVPQEKLFRMVAENPKMQFIYGLSGVEIISKKSNVVVFGDSLTQQGYIVDHFKRKIIDRKQKEYSMINRGIGGSRILKGTDKNFDPYERHGVPGLQRFESDCFSQGTPTAVIVFHGINDLITVEESQKFSLEEVILGLKQYAELCQLHGAKSYVATLLPFGKSEFYSEKREYYRQKVNAWIRSNKTYTGILDFSEVVTDNNDSRKLIDTADSGDGLHLSSFGGRRIAEKFEMEKLF